MPSRMMALAVSLVMAMLALTLPAGAQPPRDLTVATYNVYQGADFTPLLTAPNQAELARRTGEAYDQMVRTDFPSRARAIARLLRDDRPGIIGLQEVARWQRGPLNGQLRTTYDFLDILLRELQRAGLHYRPVAINDTFNATLPISSTERVGFTDRDVVLAQAQYRVQNSQSHLYQARLVVPTPSGVTFVIPRGWSTVDVRLPGGAVQRVANTHLELVAPPVRNAQGRELYAALAGSPHPVTALGDFNSTPNDTTGPYGTFTNGGYGDAWQVANGPAGGLTAQQDPDLDNVPSQLNRRIDHVFFQQPDLEAESADVIGDELEDRTPNGLWPSDHAGVVAELELE